MFCYKAIINIPVGLNLLAVVERGKFCLSVFALQSVCNEVIADMRVFGKEGAVEIGAHYIFIEHALGFVFPVIAVSVEDFSDRKSVV